jgi:hypothetical protein
MASLRSVRSLSGLGASLFLLLLAGGGCIQKEIQARPATRPLPTATTETSALIGTWIQVGDDSRDPDSPMLAFGFQSDGSGWKRWANIGFPEEPSGVRTFQWKVDARSLFLKYDGDRRPGHHTDTIPGRDDQSLLNWSLTPDASTLSVSDGSSSFVFKRSTPADTAPQEQSGVNPSIPNTRSDTGVETLRPGIYGGASSYRPLPPPGWWRSGPLGQTEDR